MGAIRINITLPEQVVRKLNKMTKQRERSAYIVEALEFYEKYKNKKNTMELMIEGYIKTYQEDLEINADWESTIADGLDDE